MKRMKAKGAGRMNCIRRMPRRIAVFFLTYRLISIMFVFSLFFFLWQHSTGFSWDFAVYSLNAQYLFSDGSYFEWNRPPLAPFIIGVLGFLSLSSEYAYIVLVSFLYLYSSIRFADSFGVDRTSYYLFSTTVFTLALGFFAGTELLSLSLLQLSVACINKKYSGLFFGLSFLARYTNIPYAILLLFQKNARKILVSPALILIVFSPWLAFNYLAKGNPFASIFDSVLLNLASRSSPVFDARDIAFSVNVALPFFILGIARTIKKLDKNEKMLLVLLILTFAAYFLTPLKEPRYLFLAVAVFSYFSCVSIKNVKCKASILVPFAVVSVFLLLLMPQAKLENPDFYRFLAEKDDCATLSNIWVPLNYYGHAASPVFHASLAAYNVSVKTDLAAAIESGYRIVLAKFVKDPFTETPPESPVIEETNSYIILGSGCGPPAGYDKSFLENVNELLSGERLVCGLSCAVETA